jgi:hypothetical protein
MYEYTTGTRPDWENVGIQFPKDMCKRGREIVSAVRALPADKQVSTVAPLFLQAVDALLHLFPKLMQDDDAREYLEPKVKEGIGRKLYIELLGGGGDKAGFVLAMVKAPQVFEIKADEYDPDVLGIRIRMDDLLGFADECLQEERLVVPDILDFFCRGKLQILSTYGRRADWSALPAVGALIFLVPKIWASFQEEKIIDELDDELKKAKV